MDMILDKATHTYTHEDKEYYSVSSVIDFICNTEGKKYHSDSIKKAMDKGTLIHAEIEDYIKNGVKGFTDELYSFISWKDKEKVNIIGSERRVWSDKYRVAGTIDIITDKGLIDIKTGSSQLLKRWSWQLSIYLFLISADENEYNQSFTRVLKLQDDKKAISIAVVKYPYSEVEEALERFKHRISTDVVEVLDCLPSARASELAELLNKQAQIEADIKEIKEIITTEMIDRGIIKLDSPILSITLVEGVVATKLDTKALKVQEPAIYNKYAKETVSKPYVKIKTKGA